MDTFSPDATAPVRKTRYHHGNLRISIIYSVAQLIGDDRGINFQLKDVAQLVGTSQPAIYKHFTNKSALLVETALEGYQLQKKFRNRSFEDTDGTPLAKAFAVVQAYVNFSRTHPGFFLLMKNLETKEILSSKRYLSERDKSVSLATSIIRDCMDDGTFLSISPQLALTFLQTIAYGLAHLYITEQMDILNPDRKDGDGFQQEVIAMGFDSLLSKMGKEKLAKICAGSVGKKN